MFIIPGSYTALGNAAGLVFACWPEEQCILLWSTRECHDVLMSSCFRIEHHRIPIKCRFKLLWANPPKHLMQRVLCPDCLMLIFGTF